VTVREQLDPDASLWQWIAVDLHFWRIKHGLSLAQLGRHLGLSRGAVSNIEAGRLNLQDHHAVILDNLWDLNRHFGRLLDYAKRGHDPNWFKSFLKYEELARVIKSYDVLLVPGLLQTPEYTRAAFVSAQVVEDVDAAVERRMARQKVLTKGKPAQLWALINQAALEQQIGGPEVMRGQLARLLEASEMSNVVLRVVPRSLGGHVALEGSFKVITFAGGAAAYMEAVGGGRLTLDSAEVERYTTRFDRIGADALSRSSSRDLIKEIMEAMK
jgi:transcriptional regulator with XRE-family HTH domain